MNRSSAIPLVLVTFMTLFSWFPNVLAQDPTQDQVHTRVKVVEHICDFGQGIGWVTFTVQSRSENGISHEIQGYQNSINLGADLTNALRSTTWSSQLFTHPAYTVDEQVLKYPPPPTGPPYAGATLRYIYTLENGPRVQTPATTDWWDVLTVRLEYNLPGDPNQRLDIDWNIYGAPTYRVIIPDPQGSDSVFEVQGDKVPMPVELQNNPLDCLREFGAQGLPNPPSRTFFVFDSTTFIGIDQTHVDAEETEEDGSEGDGIAFSGLFAGNSNASVTVDVSFGAETEGYVNAWIDWNNDGDWSDTGEHILGSPQLVNTASTTFNFAVPGTVNEGDQRWARFLFSTGDATAVENAVAGEVLEYGEVQDYHVTVTQEDQADLQVEKSADNDEPVVGDQVTFTISVTNAGPDDANNVVIADNIPSNWTYISHNENGWGTFNSNTEIWTIASGIPASQTAELTLVLRLDSMDPGDPFYNCAEVTTSDVTDPDPSNNEDCAPDDVDGYADLQMQKTVNPSTIDAGGSATFTVTVTNAGPDDASNIIISDPLPSGLTFGAITPSAGSWNSTTEEWTIPTLAVGASATLTIPVTAPDAGQYTNVASVTSSTEHDPDPNDDSASATLTVSANDADIEISKSASASEVDVNDPVTFTVTVHNFGPETATNIQVRDYMPSGIEVTSTNPSVTFSSGEAVWTIASLAAGGDATLTINGVARVPGMWSNIAVLESLDQNDPNSSNDSDAATVRVHTQDDVPDIQLAKTVDSPTKQPGDNVTFTVTVTNLTTITATQVEVYDIFNGDLNFISANPSQGSYDPSSQIWSVGSLAGNAAATLTIEAQIPMDAEGVITNYALVTQVLPGDDDPNNDFDWAIITIEDGDTPESDLIVSKDVSNNNPRVGESITYTISLHNNGPDAATNVVVLERIPEGIDYTSHTAPSGTYYSPASGWWYVPSIASGQSLDLMITGTVQADRTIKNCAVVYRSYSHDPDLSNDWACMEIEPGNDSDIEISKSASETEINVNDPITFTVSVHNFGPETATNIQVRDYMPSGIEVTSTNPSVTFAAGEAVWTIASLAAGGDATLTINGVARVPGMWSNIAVLESLDQNDPNSSNDSDAATVRVHTQDDVPDIQLAKTVDSPTKQPGDNVTFTVTVTNLTTITATQVEVYDIFNGDLNFISANPSQGSYDPSSQIWSVGSLAGNAAATLTIEAQIPMDAEGVITNYALVTQVLPGDDDPNNDFDWAIITIYDGNTPESDLIVSKDVSNDNPTVGESITYTVSVHNNGPDAASNVVILEKIPQGISYTAHNAPSGTYYSPASGWWYIPSIASGQTMVLTVTGTVQRDGTIRNCVVVYRSYSHDPDLSNDWACHEIIVPPVIGACIDSRLILVSNTPNVPSPGQGTLIFQVQARDSNNVCSDIRYFTNNVEVDTNLIRLDPQIEMRDTFFGSAYDRNLSWHPTPTRRTIDFEWMLRPGETPRQICGDWVTVLEVEFVYTMRVVEGYISWSNMDPEFQVLNTQGEDITCNELENLPVIRVTYPVELSSFSASFTNGVVNLEWVTQSETDNYGFEIERAENENGEYHRITKEVIPGAGNSTSAHSYHFEDNSALAGKTYFYRLVDIDLNGVRSYHGPIMVNAPIPEDFSLEQNYPNPFNPETQIQFRLNEPGNCTLSIYNLRGQMVRTLVNRSMQAGTHMVTWDGLDNQGNVMPSGTYLYKLEFNDQTRVKKMELIK